MSMGFLLDVHLPRWWRRTLTHLYPELQVYYLDDPGAPGLAAADPIILDWCGAQNCLLVTNNRRSMPGHLADHRARGRHGPEILAVDPALSVTLLAEDLALIASASADDEFWDQIRYLPL
jgi:hypothetical protein